MWNLFLIKTISYLWPADGVLSDLEDLDLSDLEFSLNVSCPQLTCVDL